MDVVFKIFQMVLNEPTGFSIVRDNKEYHLTEEELQRAVFYHYDRLGQIALEEACYKAGKKLSDEVKNRLAEEITLNMTIMVDKVINDIKDNPFSTTNQIKTINH